MLQILCGSGIMSYSTYFFEAAGRDTGNAFAMTTGQYALGAFGTLCCWWFVSVWGRRTIYLVGLTSSLLLLLIVGFIGLSSSDGAQWGIGVLMLVYTFMYDSTIGPVCYSLVAEISSTRLRSKTIVVARIFYNMTNIVNNIITPRMINSTAWDWGTKGAFFWAGICFLCTIWAFFRLPELRGRMYAELDKLFEQEVSARDFSKAVIQSSRVETISDKEDRGT
jgi:SP family general alpha glucoside:H+ symporter-like MFS transporter